MKVLVNALSASKGGIVTYTRNLLRAFSDMCVDATVAVPDEFDSGGHENVHRIRVSHFPPPKRFLWEQTVWRHTVARLRPDVLFSSADFGLMSGPVPQLLLLREGALFDPAYLADVAPAQGVGAVFNRYIRRRLMLSSAARSTRIMTPTAAMRDLVIQWRPSLADKCSVNPCGALMDKFSPAPRTRAWREDGTLRILYVSVYFPHKFPNLICRTVDQLDKSGVKAHATITMRRDEFDTVRGSGVDEATVVAAAESGSITLGHVDYDDLPDLYANHDVFVFPSVSEAFGHPMAEAMSMKLPILAADTAVNREICGDVAGYFEPYSVTGIVEGLLRLDAQPIRREEMSNAGRGRVRDRFSWEGHVSRLGDTLDELASTKA